MSRLLVTQVPDPVLNKKAKAIPEITQEIFDLAKNMKETMHESNGVGLAAPQVSESVRMFVVQHKDGDMAFINPEITWYSPETKIGEEGCLSIPGVFLDIKRHESIEIKFQDEHGASHHIRAKGFFARVIQHEYDHLDGILITDRVKEHEK